MSELEQYLADNMREGLRVTIQPLWQRFVNPDRNDFVYLCMLSDWKNGFASWTADGVTPVLSVQAAFEKMRADTKPRFRSAKKVGRRS